MVSHGGHVHKIVKLNYGDINEFIFSKVEKTPVSL